MKHWAFATALIVSLCSSQVALSKDTKSIRLAHVAPPGTSWATAGDNLAKDVAERFDGRFEMTVFPSSQLGNEARMLQQVQTGALDMAYLSTAEPLNKIKDLGVFYKPFLVDSVEEAKAILNGEVAGKLLERFQIELGVVGLGYAMGGRRVILTNFELNTPEDMKGRKIRITPVEPAEDFYRMTGASPTPVPLPNLFDALANKQVDGVDMELEVISAVKLQDHASHLYLTYHQLNPMVAVVSRNFWNGLSDEDKVVFHELVKKSMTEIFATQFESEVRIEKEMHDDRIIVAAPRPDLFGGAISEWENVWSTKTDLLDDIEAEMKQIREN